MDTAMETLVGVLFLLLIVGTLSSTLTYAALSVRDNYQERKRAKNRANQEEE